MISGRGGGRLSHPSATPPARGQNTLWIFRPSLKPSPNSTYERDDGDAELGTVVGFGPGVREGAVGNPIFPLRRHRDPHFLYGRLNIIGTDVIALRSSSELHGFRREFGGRAAIISQLST